VKGGRKIQTDVSVQKSEFRCLQGLKGAESKGIESRIADYGFRRGVVGEVILALNED
jgi:hypothetical protein